jgi:hypothetical protein
MTADALTIAHALPGRLRLRLPPGVDADDLAAAVGAFDGVTSCTWSPRTRGLLVRYDHGATDATTIIEGIATRAGIERPAAPVTAANAEPLPPVATVVPAMFAEANHGLTRATRGALGLGSAIPLLLVGWAALELLRGRAAPLAWSSALWYAHGLFRDYNLPSSSS